jgi:hypothetical protein
MATGAYFTSLGYRFYIKAGTTASSAPSSSTGLTEVLSLVNAGIQGSSDTTDVLDYGSTQGFKASLVTGQSYTIPMTMNLDLRDAAYAILKDAALNATTKTLEWYRESPEMSASGNPEKHAGVAFVTDFSESIEAGGVAQVNFTLQGLGAYVWTAETDSV